MNDNSKLEELWNLCSSLKFNEFLSLRKLFSIFIYDIILIYQLILKRFEYEHLLILLNWHSLKGEKKSKMNESLGIWSKLF